MLADSNRLGGWLLFILSLFANSAKAVDCMDCFSSLAMTKGTVIASTEGTKQSIHTWNLLQQIKEDYCSYYSIQNLKLPLSGLAIGGITANAEFDFMFRDHWQNKLRSHTTNDIADFIDDYSQFTHWYYSIPVYGLSLFVPNHAIQQWGNISLRMLALGAPQQAVLTSFLGSSRPPIGKPQWHPFEYHRGVSGHAFYGAVPLLALAAIQENSYLKWSCYTLSILPGLARINNDKHYFTQAFLGWWLAYSALNAISPAKTTVYAIPLENGIFLAGRIHF